MQMSSPTDAELSASSLEEAGRFADAVRWHVVFQCQRGKLQSQTELNTPDDNFRHGLCQHINQAGCGQNKHGNADGKPAAIWGGPGLVPAPPGPYRHWLSVAGPALADAGQSGPARTGGSGSSVTTAVTSSAGVMSKARLTALVPAGAAGTVTSSSARCPPGPAIPSSSASCEPPAIGGSAPSEVAAATCATGRSSTAPPRAATFPSPSSRSARSRRE